MSKGITLIETVIGLAILSFGMLAIMAAFPIGLKILSQNQQTNTALFLASSKVEELSGERYEDLEIGEYVESFDLENYEDYQVETDIDCFNQQAEEYSEEDIKKITVTAFSKSEKSNKATLTTLITEK